MTTDPHNPLSYATPSHEIGRPTGPFVTLVVIGTGLSTLIIYSLASIYGSFGAAEWLCLGMVPVILFGAIALTVALLSKAATRSRIGVLLMLSLAPATVSWLAVVAVSKAQAAAAPYDRLRDLLGGDSMPGIVHASFVGHDRSLDDSLTIQFHFAGGDFDRIVKANRFEKIQNRYFINLNDRFNDGQYLKIGDGDEFYQRPSPSGGSGMDTIRVNREHTSVILRSESDAQVRQQQIRTSGGS